MSEKERDDDVDSLETPVSGPESGVPQGSVDGPKLNDTDEVHSSNSERDERDMESNSMSLWTFNAAGAISPPFSGSSSFADESQHSESSMNVFDLNILVCGKSGNGKSTVGNFLIGYEKFLTGFLGTNLNEPLHCEIGEAKMKFKSAGIGTMRLIDTPGLFDFESDPLETLSTMGQVVYSLPGGLHAFIFVLPYNETLTDDDGKVLGEMSEFFSRSMMKYTFFLLNSYRSDISPPDNLAETQPNPIQRAISKSTQKVWLVNPMETCEEKRQDMRRSILSDIIENLNKVGKPYDSAQLTSYHARKQEQEKLLKCERDLNQLKLYGDNELSRLRKENEMRAELMTRIEFESFNDTGIGRKVFIEVEKECNRRQFTDSTCPVQ